MRRFTQQVPVTMMRCAQAEERSANALANAACCYDYSQSRSLIVELTYRASA